MDYSHVPSPNISHWLIETVCCLLKWAYSKADAKEIRFTQTDKNLYVTVLGWPEDGKILIRSLAEGNGLYPTKIGRVELLGYGKVSFTRTDKGLVVDIPAKSLKNIAPVLKIRK